MVMGYPEYEDNDKEYENNDKPDSGQDKVESAKEEIVESVLGPKFGIPWKSIIGFLSVFVGQLVARSTVEGIPVIPDNISGISSLIGGSFVAAAVIWLKSNVYTVPQANDKLNVAEARALKGG